MRVNNCPASPMHRLDQVVNHLPRNEHPLLLESLKQLVHIYRGIHSASSMSLQLIPSVFVGVSIWKHGLPRVNLDAVVGEELRGVACCIGSSTVVLKYNAMRRLMCEIPQPKNMRFYV